MSREVTAPSPPTSGPAKPFNPWPGPVLLAGGGYQDGGLLLNRLGLQALRLATVNLAFRARKRPVDDDLEPHVEAFDRDGVVLIENFLAPDVFARIREECRQAREAGLFKERPLDDVVNKTIKVTAREEALRYTWEQLTTNDRLLRLAAAFTRLPGIDPDRMKIDVDYMAKRPADVAPPDKLLGAEHLHADTHYPSAKAWLMLDDIDEQNGAFMYAKGSKQLNLARIAYEYDASVRTAQALRNGTAYVSVPIGVVRAPTPRQLKAMAIVETSVSGKANTIVFADVMGFHRRGTFAEGATREQVIFRFGDRPVERRRPS